MMITMTIRKEMHEFPIYRHDFFELASPVSMGMEFSSRGP